MKSLFVTREFPYDGTQLRSLYGYLEHKIQGDSVISWIGPCSISFDHMVDGEDLLEQSPIEGARMVHFIIEKFHTPLMAGVALQRLFASICHDHLRASLGAALAFEMRRSGDDLYFRDGKLSEAQKEFEALGNATEAPDSIRQRAGAMATLIRTSGGENFGIVPPPKPAQPTQQGTATP